MKCDEQKPTCQACKNREQTCVYESVASDLSSLPEDTILHRGLEGEADLPEAILSSQPPRLIAEASHHVVQEVPTSGAGSRTVPDAQTDRNTLNIVRQKRNWLVLTPFPLRYCAHRMNPSTLACRREASVRTLPPRSISASDRG